MTASTGAWSQAAPAERALVAMCGSFGCTIAASRVITAVASKRARPPPCEASLAARANTPRSDSTRVHHYLPGIGITVATALAGVLTRSDGGEVILAVPLGIGTALVSDEIKLLLEHSNPFWGSEQLAMLQIAGAAAMATVTAVRVRARSTASASAIDTPIATG